MHIKTWKLCDFVKALLNFMIDDDISSLEDPGIFNIEY